jgi:hypothetical protein
MGIKVGNSAGWMSRWFEIDVKWVAADDDISQRCCHWFRLSLLEYVGD